MIGGVAIFGGSGTVWGAAIGAVLLVTISRALPILGIADFWQRRRRRRAHHQRAIVLDRVLAPDKIASSAEARDSHDRVHRRATRARRPDHPRDSRTCGSGRS